MPTVQPLPESIAAAKLRLEQYLAAKHQQNAISDPRLAAAMEYSLLLGGKRLRPFLVYATGDIFGATKTDLDIPAAALEAIHSYSLIHDDLPAMDDDDLRRGQPTCHIKFDEATAILAGDTLQSFAFQLLSSGEFKSLDAQSQLLLIKTISDAATQMCVGQSIDLQQTDAAESPLTPEQALIQLKNMHKLKTGALIKASVISGAICGGANSEELKHLSRYAECIGLAFQVWDDVLDIISDTETLGKPQGSDLDANKMTYPALLGLEQAKQKAKNLVSEAVQALQHLPYNTAVLEQLAHFIIERDH